ncbi:MAG TPA: hypothetical protein DCO83_16605 [Mucilaginibacter sp.]|jgi:hypothetical protein|nr:hypothetical protein [Mucilaginibacter sp.]
MKTITPSKQISQPITFICLLLLLSFNSKSQNIQPYKAREITSYRAKAIPVNSSTNKSNAAAQSNSDLSYFIGTYQIWVPGTSYTTPDYSNNQLIIHNSAGTGLFPGGIKINANGTYIWNSSWDKKIIRGKWRTTNNKNYPIELVKAQEGKDWKTGSSNTAGVSIIIWDGYTWYNGKKIK